MSSKNNKKYYENAIRSTCPPTPTPPPPTPSLNIPMGSCIPSFDSRLKLSVVNLQKGFLSSSFSVSSQ